MVWNFIPSWQIHDNQKTAKKNVFNVYFQRKLSLYSTNYKLETLEITYTIIYYYHLLRSVLPVMLSVVLLLLFCTVHNHGIITMVSVQDILNRDNNRINITEHKNVNINISIKRFDCYGTFPTVLHQFENDVNLESSMISHTYYFDKTLLICLSLFFNIYQWVIQTWVLGRYHRKVNRNTFFYRAYIYILFLYIKDSRVYCSSLLNN